MLMEAGFSENAAKKALLFSGADPNAAMEWLLEHSGDLDLDLPLNPQQARQLLQRMTPQMAAAHAPATAAAAAGGGGGPAGGAGAGAGPRVDAAVEQCMAGGTCSFHATGKTYKPQFYFHCYTCGFSNNEV